jgi:hypothetical protein
VGDHDRPRDYPDGFVVRELHIVRGSDKPVITGDAVGSQGGAQRPVPVRLRKKFKRCCGR